MTAKYFRQGRVFASGPDEAAMQVRDLYNEHAGDLVIFYVNGHGGGWYEYMICLTGDNEPKEIPGREADK